MGKLITGFVLGFLACVWTYGLNPTEAIFGFSHKISEAHHDLQTRYDANRPHGHKGQYANVDRIRAFQNVSADGAQPFGALAHRNASWLSRVGGLPPM